MHELHANVSFVSSPLIEGFISGDFFCAISFSKAEQILRTGQEREHQPKNKEHKTRKPHVHTLKSFCLKVARIYAP